MTALEKISRTMLTWCSRQLWDLKNTRIILGVSGGSDSVAMSHIFAYLRDLYNIELHILHINHHLRGKSSAKDEDFTRKLAKKLNIDYIKHDIDPPETAIEENCRILRYEIYEKYAKELDAEVFLAHTANDQTETLLFNLFRGTGPRGLSGMPPKRPIGRHYVYRPLLFATRQDLTELLGELGEEWCEDVSNQDENFSRNYIRRLVVPPLIEKFGTGAFSRILNTTLVQREFVDNIEKSISHYYKKLPYDIYIILDQIRCFKHSGIFGEVIRQVLDDLGIGLSRFSDDLVKRLLDNKCSNRTELFEGYYFENYKHFSIIYHENISDMLQIRKDITIGENSIDNYGSLELSNPEDSVHICNTEGLFSAHFALTKPGQLYLANPDPGELFTPFRSSKRKFTQYARDRNIPRFLRNSIPVLYCDGEPVWAIGLGITNEFKVHPDKKIFYRVNFKGDWKTLINSFKLIS